MVRREVIRISLLAVVGLCLAIILFADNHNWNSFFLIAYVPCITYGGIALIKWLWGLFRWFMQMQFMSIMHRSILGVILAMLALAIGFSIVMLGGMVAGLYKIVRNLIEDARMDQNLIMDE